MLNLLIGTNLNGLSDCLDLLNRSFNVYYEPNFSPELGANRNEIDGFFVNPNNLKYTLDSGFFDSLPNLRVVATASTGLVHIDLEECKRRGIEVLSLTKRYSMLNRVSATAELALTFTLMGLRKITNASSSVSGGTWDWSDFIGRQVDGCTFGVVGLGRLGSMYARMVNTMGGKVIFYDPFIKNRESLYEQMDTLSDIARKADVVSLHLHATKANHKLIDAKNFFDHAHRELIVVNTSRGELVDEEALLRFLDQNDEAYYYTDVIANEHQWLENAVRQRFASGDQQIYITPHIGGMTYESRAIAYRDAAEQLIEFFKER